MRLGDVARRFSLSTDLVTSTITARLGSSIHGKLDQQLLYTAAHMRRIKARVSPVSHHLLDTRSPLVK